MGRYLPPKAPSSAYITEEGSQAMKDELEELWRVERPKVTQAVSDAAALGDRSENADYIYGKRRLREIDGRVRFLSKRLESLTVVPARHEETDTVYFGAWVQLENEDGELSEYRIVGPDESDAGSCAISMDSPMGKALLGKKVGGEIRVKRPVGIKTFEVVSVRYA